jgi:hypothetical protein
MKIPVFATLISITLLSGSLLTAQTTGVKMPVDPDTKLITYKEVVTTSGTPEELYIRAIAWVNKEYKNPADATKVRDAETGLIEIIHRFELTQKVQGVTLKAATVDYSLKLELKDGRFRYTITNFNEKTISRQPIERWMDKNNQSWIPAWDDYLKQVDEQTHKLIERLKLAMQPPAVKKPDTW